MVVGGWGVAIVCVFMFLSKKLEIYSIFRA